MSKHDEQAAQHAARPSHQPATCPTCHQPGEAVPGQTVKALFAVSLRQLGAQVYRFCPTQDCLVVYFAAEGSHALLQRKFAR
jgi:hypothetical protein